MPFGKYRGVPLGGIPSDYLDWVLRNLVRLRPGLRFAIQRILQDRECEPLELVPQPNDLPALIGQWYHGLVMDYHPDRGGHPEAMRAINEAHKRLQEVVKQSDDG